MYLQIGDMGGVIVNDEELETSLTVENDQSKKHYIRQNNALIHPRRFQNIKALVKSFIGK